MAIIDFGGMREEVVMRDEFPLTKAQEVLKKESVTILGYGPQGQGQSLNMRDNGINIIIGQAKEDKTYWDKAVADGWIPGKTLFPIEEAVQRGTIIQYLSLRCCTNVTLAKSKTEPEKRRCIVLFTRFLYSI